MTVGQLIRKLSRYNPDTEVLITECCSDAHVSVDHVATRLDECKGRVFAELNFVSEGGGE
jgi:hypothetical protein